MVFVVWLLDEQLDEQLHQRGHGVHPEESAERLAHVHHNEPGRKAKERFPEAVLKLRVGSEGWNDPQLKDER